MSSQARNQRGRTKTAELRGSAAFVQEPRLAKLVLPKFKMASLAAKTSVFLQGAAKNARPGLTVAWKYAKSELRPPTPAEIPQAIAGMSGLVASFGRRSWRKLTVKEAWLNTLVALEISFWFFVGETIGRRKLVGYAPGFGYKGGH